MAEVKNFPILAKTSVTSNDYLPVTGQRRLQVQSLFPSLATTGVGGQSIYINVTNANQLNFKGLKSATTGMLSIATNANNIDFSVLPAGIDLSLCDNTTSLFLDSVDLTSDVGITVLPVTNGGTGLSTIAKGAILYASNNDVIAGTSALTNGQLLIGNTGTGVPSIATLTAGTNMTVTNGAGTITLAANLSTLTAALNCDIYNINLNAAAGASWVSGDGTAEGIYVDANGRVFIGDSLPSLPSLSGQLTLGGNGSDALRIGNTSSYGNRRVKMVDNTAAAGGAQLTIEGATGGTGNQFGGNIIIEAGSGSGSGTGGTLKLLGGNTGGGNSGEVIIGNTKGVSEQAGIIVDLDGNVKLDSGYLRYSDAPQVLVGAGAVNLISQITHIETTGTDALTLADGVEGQTKIIVMTVDGGNGTLTPTNGAGYTTLGFHDVGDSVHLLFTNGKWFILGDYGMTIS
jgi:hypothetical protein